MARSPSLDFWLNSKFGKRRNTVCTRKGYAASVSQLTLATAAQYFSFFKLKKWGKKTAAARRHNCAVLPLFYPPCLGGSGLGFGDQLLLLLSDGIGTANASAWARIACDTPPGDLAAQILRTGAQPDDATAVVIRMKRKEA